jgi:hypothetical protein
VPAFFVRRFNRYLLRYICFRVFSLVTNDDWYCGGQAYHRDVSANKSSSKRTDSYRMHHYLIFKEAVYATFLFPLSGKAIIKTACVGNMLDRQSSTNAIHEQHSELSSG